MTRSRNVVAAWLVVLLLSSAYVSRLLAASPTQQIRSTVERVLEILKDPRFQGEVKRRERREQLRQIILPRFDFAEMAKRSLGNHWRRYQSRQQEFVSAFTGFAEDSYVSQIESYKDEKILYIQERVDKQFCEVETKVVPIQDNEVPIHYRLHLVEEQWRVYDVHIDNISLVNNYRSQFNRIISTASFDELLRKLQERRIKGVGSHGARLGPAARYLLLPTRAR